MEFLMYFDIDRTRFAEKAFSIMDEDCSGDVDFREFVVAVWNYCSCSKSALVLFAFDLYDLDGSGHIDVGEMRTVLSDLYGDVKNNAYVSRMLRKVDDLDVHGGGISMPTFKTFCMTHHAMLFPAFRMQRILQRKVLGLKYWNAIAKKRSTATLVTEDGIVVPDTWSAVYNLVCVSDQASKGSVTNRRRRSREHGEVPNLKERVRISAGGDGGDEGKSTSDPTTFVVRKRHVSSAKRSSYRVSAPRSRREVEQQGYNGKPRRNSEPAALPTAATTTTTAAESSIEQRRRSAAHARVRESVNSIEIGAKLARANASSSAEVASTGVLQRKKNHENDNNNRGPLSSLAPLSASKSERRNAKAARDRRRQARRSARASANSGDKKRTAVAVKPKAPRTSVADAPANTRRHQKENVGSLVAAFKTRRPGAEAKRRVTFDLAGRGEVSSKDQRKSTAPLSDVSNRRPKNPDDNNRAAAAQKKKPPVRPRGARSRNSNPRRLPGLEQMLSPQKGKFSTSTSRHRALDGVRRSNIF